MTLEFDRLEIETLMRCCDMSKRLYLKLQDNFVTEGNKKVCDKFITEIQAIRDYLEESLATR